MPHVCSHQLRSVTATFSSVQAVTIASYPTVLHSCRHLLDSLLWPRYPLSTSLLVSASPTHTHFERSSLSNLQTFSYDVTQLSLSWQTTQKNPTTLENKSRAPVPEGSRFSWWKYGTFDINWDRKGFKTRLYWGGGEWEQIKCWDKAINCCIYSTSVSTWCARADLFKAS